MLRSFLESHPEIICQGEFFNSDSRTLPYGLDTPTEELLTRHIYHARFPEQIRHVGFVLHSYHPWALKAFNGIRENPCWGDVWDRLRAMSGLRVVHLYRRNLLLRHLSHQLARTTGFWHHWRSDKYERVSHLGSPPSADQIGRKRAVPSAISLDPAALKADFEEVEILRDRVRKLFRNHAFCEVMYEDLCRDSATQIRRVLEFLGAEVRPVETALKKVENRHPREAISNYEALRMHFRPTRWASFFEE